MIDIQQYGWSLADLQIIAYLLCIALLGMSIIYCLWYCLAELGRWAIRRRDLRIYVQTEICDVHRQIWLLQDEIKVLKKKQASQHALASMQHVTPKKVASPVHAKKKQ